MEGAARSVKADNVPRHGGDGNDTAYAGGTTTPSTEMLRQEIKH
jgi:hypothetical protein